MHFAVCDIIVRKCLHQLLAKRYYEHWLVPYWPWKYRRKHGSFKSIRYFQQFYEKYTLKLRICNGTEGGKKIKPIIKVINSKLMELLIVLNKITSTLPTTYASKADDDVIHHCKTENTTTLIWCRLTTALPILPAILWRAYIQISTHTRTVTLILAVVEHIVEIFHHFESLLITRISAPFSSLSRWLSVRRSFND